MPLVIDEAFLPATLSASPMSDTEFAAFCAMHPDYFIEMTAEGEILIMPPNYTLTGVRNSKICFQLETWNATDQRGTCTDSSTGFVLPNGARRSPDAAWTLNQRIVEQHSGSYEGYWHLCPNFVIELKSNTDRIATLRLKMREWVGNGAELAWLIDPECRAVEIYRPGRDPETLVGVQSLAGEGSVEGFILDLQPVWVPLPF
jgi:Uma2 family endonuclease